MNRALLLLLTAVFVGLSLGSEASDQTCEGLDCPIPGSSVLQVKTHAQRSELEELVESAEEETEAEVAEADEDEGFDLEEEEGDLLLFEEGAETETEEETEVEDELEEELFEGGRIEIHAGSQVVIHDDSEVARSGYGKWVITVSKNCTTADVDKMAKNMPNGTVPKFKGDPSAGGLCVFIMEGTKAGVIKELETHTWPSKPLVESDKKWSLIPDLDKTEKDDDYSLLAMDAEGQTNPPSWGLDRVDDRSGQDKDYSPPAASQGGSGAHVYVADTGIRTTHKEFGGRAIPTLEVLSSTRKVCSATDTSCAADRQGHGTHCAGTIGGTSYGVAKLSTLHAVKVLSDSGSGSFSWFIEALDWVMTSGIKPAVFSASLGGRGTISTVQQAIDKAVAAGVTVVVAAGNSGRTSVPDACKYSPAYVPSAITVGATQLGDNRASYSSYGSCLDIYAPGSSIKSAGHRSDTGSATMSGTSMACPHVAGASALILAEDSSRTPADVLTVMLSRATSGVVKDAKTGSPNLMLYTGLDTNAPTPAPLPTPSPTPWPTLPSPAVAGPSPTSAVGLRVGLRALGRAKMEADFGLEENFSGSDEERRQAEEQDQQQPPGTGPYATLHTEGPQVSAGSAGHPDGCMPCTFYCFTRRGCNRGLECRFCHLTHQSKLQQRREAWKKQQREKRKSIRERVAAETLQRRHPGSGLGGKGGFGALENEGLGSGNFQLGGPGTVTQSGGGRIAPMASRKYSDTSSLNEGPNVPATTAVFTYSPGRAILTIGQEVEFRPQLTVRATGFRLSVPLPQGLALDAASGIISGAPVAPAAKMTVVVEADLGGHSAHAVVDLEVVDFTRGGFVIGHMSEPEPGKFMMLLYVPEEEQNANEARQDLGDRTRGGGRPAAARKNGAPAKQQKGAGVDPAAAMRAMGRPTHLQQPGRGGAGLPGPGGLGGQEPKSAVAAAAAAAPLDWW